MMNIFFLKEATNNNRIVGLDFLRSCAIILVLISHGNRMVHIPIKGAGYFGVELFFVLSGFLIGTILIQIHEKGLNLKSLANFWRRRWFRTLPNYYLFLIANIILSLSIGITALTIVTYFTFLQCIVYRITPIMAESWSLCVEEWFYIFFPLWLFCWSKITLNKKKGFLFATLSFIIFFTILRVSVAFLIVDRSWDYGFRCATLLRLDSIGYGVLIAWLSQYHKEITIKYKELFLFFGLFGLIASAALLHKNDIINKTIIFSMTNISFSLLIPFSCQLEISNKYIRYLFCHISIISYSLYLIHYSFILKYIPKIHISSPYVNYTIYWLTSLLLATIVYNYYEKRMTSIRNRYSSSETVISKQISLS